MKAIADALTPAQRCTVNWQGCWIADHWWIIPLVLLAIVALFWFLSRPRKPDPPTFNFDHQW